MISFIECSPGAPFTAYISILYFIDDICICVLSSATNDQEELFDAILTGDFEFLSPYWDDISATAKVRKI